MAEMHSSTQAVGRNRLSITNEYSFSFTVCLCSDTRTVILYTQSLSLHISMYAALPVNSNAMALYSYSSALCTVLSNTQLLCSMVHS